MSIPIILYAGPLPCWIMFFVFGVLIGHYPQRRYSVILPVIILVAGLVMSIIESNYLLFHYGKGVGIKPSSFIYSAGMVFLMFSSKLENLIRRTGAIYRFTTWIGTLSFGIYLIHCNFVSLIIKLLPIDIWLLKWALVLLLTALMMVTMRKIRLRCGSPWIAHQTC